ncbi:MAG: ankyrin repeat domain-containing protein [Vulcanimicrobiota bacterium]
MNFKKSLPLITLSFLLCGELWAQPPIVGPSINIQPPAPVRAHTMKSDARKVRDSSRPTTPAPASNSSTGSGTVEKAPPIHRASADGQVEPVRTALAANPDLVKARDSSGYTPLHHAAIGGHPEVVEVLLAHGARVDVLGSRGETALFLASSAGSAEVVKLLLQNGADPNKAGSDGKTPLHKAAMVGNAEAVEALLTAGAMPETKDRSGRTALDLAERYQAGDSRRVVTILQAATR